MLQICLEEDYIVLMHGEEHLSGQTLSKDHSWRTVEISWVLRSET